MFQIDDELKALATKVIANRKDLKRLDTPECRVAYLYSDKEKKSHGKAVYADTEKVSEKVKTLTPYDFIVTFYRPSCAGLSAEKMEILMHHELKHIGFEPGKPCYIVPHDVEDFSDIIDEHGMNWII